MREGTDKFFVQGDGNGWWRRVDIGGTVPFFGSGHEGELAHGKYLSVRFQNGAVHDPVLVIEYAEIDEFRG